VVDAGQASHRHGSEAETSVPVVPLTSHSHLTLKAKQLDDNVGLH